MTTTTAQLQLTEQRESGGVVDFNRLALIYRWMEWFTFGPLLWRCRCGFLGQLQRRRSALIIGDGDGRFASRLLRENRRITIDAIDASAAMLTELQRRAGSDGSRLCLHLADARAFDPIRHDYDLIVTHFFLDCLTIDEVRQLATRLRSAVVENAAWVVSEFAVPAGWYGRAVARPLIAALYWAFRCITGLETRSLPDPCLSPARCWLENHRATQVARRSARERIVGDVGTHVRGDKVRCGPPSPRELISKGRIRELVVEFNRLEKRSRLESASSNPQVPKNM